MKLATRTKLNARPSAGAVISGVIATGDRDGVTTIWTFDPSARPPRLHLASQTPSWTTYYHGISAIALDTSGSWMFTGSDDRTGIVWELRSRANGPEAVPRFRLRTNEGQVNCAAFADDGTSLAVGDEAGASLWSLNNATAEGLSDPVRLEDAELYLDVTGIAFSSDAMRLVTGHSLGQVRVWNVKSGAAPHMLSGKYAHPYRPSGYRWPVPKLSPQGERVVSASSDGTVIWVQISENGELNVCHEAVLSRPIVGFIDEEQGWVAQFSKESASMSRWLWPAGGAPVVRQTDEIPWSGDEYILATTSDGEWAITVQADLLGLWKM